MMAVAELNGDTRTALIHKMFGSPCYFPKRKIESKY